MTLFIKFENGELIGHPILEDNIRDLFPGRFQADHVFTPEDVIDSGYTLYVKTDPPIATFPNKVIETEIYLGSNNIAYQGWAVVEMSEEEKNIVLEQKRIECDIERSNCAQCNIQ